MKDLKYNKLIFPLLSAILILVIFFGVSCVILNNRVNRMVEKLENTLNTAQLTIDFGNNNKRVFKGSTGFNGLDLSEILSMINNISDIDVEFNFGKEGEIYLKSIDEKENNGGHFWIIFSPKLGWMKTLSNNFDLRKIVITNGLFVELRYQ
jgi:hypothetical protein